jgi:hypothetical protein
MGCTEFSGGTVPRTLASPRRGEEPLRSGQLFPVESKYSAQEDTMGWNGVNAFSSSACNVMSH